MYFLFIFLVLVSCFMLKTRIKHLIDKIKQDDCMCILSIPKHKHNFKKKHGLYQVFIM